jgi:hypothetical protein
MDSSTGRTSRLSTLPIHRRRRWRLQQVAQGYLQALQENILDNRDRFATDRDLEATILATLDGRPPEETLSNQLRLRRQR